MTDSIERAIGIESVNNKGFISINEILFFASYIPLLAYLVLETSFYGVYIGKYWKFVIVWAFIILFFKEIMNERFRISEVKGITIVLFLSAVAGSIAMGPAGNSMVMTFLFAFCCREIPYKKIAVVSLVVISLSIAIIVISAHYGIILEYIELGARKRSYLGFRYSLYGPMMISNCTCLWIYIREQKLSLPEVAFLVGINYWFYVKTNSRLSFFLTIILLMVIYLYIRWMDDLLRHKAVCSIMISSFILSAFFSITLSKAYDPNKGWMLTINNMFGNRLNLGKASLQQYGFKLFGNHNLQLVGNGLDVYGNRTVGEYNYVDCFYIQILQRYGLLFFALIMIVVTYALYKSYIEKDIYYLCIMAFIAVHCMIDDLPQYFYYNTFWIAIGSFLSAKVKEKNRDIISDDRSKLPKDARIFT